MDVVYLSCTLIVGTYLDWLFFFFVIEGEHFKPWTTYLWEGWRAMISQQKIYLPLRGYSHLHIFSHAYFATNMDLCCILTVSLWGSSTCAHIHKHTGQHSRITCFQNRQIAHSVCQKANLYATPWRQTDPSTSCQL